MIHHGTRSRRAAASVRALLCASLLWGAAEGTRAQTQPAEPDTSQAATAAAPLRDAQTVTVAQRADEAVSYVIEALAGRGYLLRVEQQGLDLIVTVESPDGAAVSYNSPLFRDGPEIVLLEAVSDGAHRITVHSDEHTGATGGHAVRYTELSESAPPAEIAAWRLMTAAAAANFESGEEAWAEAVAAYSAAAALWGDLGRQEERAHAAFSAATVEYWQRYDWDTSAALAATAERLYAELGQEALAANAMQLRAAALVEKALEVKAEAAGAEGDDEHGALFDDALRLFAEARAVHERLGNVYDLGSIINYVGYTHYSRGELEEARAYYEEASALMQNAGEWTAELTPLSNLAVLDAEAGHFRAAIDTWTRITELLPEGKLQRYRAEVLDNLGLAQQMFGNAEEALRVLSTALEIQRGIEDLQGQGRTLRGIGQTYYGLGELELATQYLRQALPLALETHDGRTQEAIYRVLGNIAYLDADYAAALAQHELALGVVGSVSDRAYLQLLAARDLRALGRTERAMERVRDARTVAEAASSPPLLADALHESGRVLLDQGDAERATEELRRAADLYDRLGLTGKQAEALHSLALAARARGNLPEAVELSEAALERIESLRRRVADPELRAFFAASRGDYYDFHVDLLMTLHAMEGSAEPLRQALHTSERARARFLADVLQEASVELRHGFDAELQQRQAALVARLADLSRERDVLLAAHAAHLGDDELGRVLADLTGVENQLNLVQIEQRRRSPEFAALTAPSALTVLEMQSVLDPDTVLLQYSLADDRSFVWVVTRTDVVGVELADRATIEAAARNALEGLKTYRPEGGAAVTEALERLSELALAPVARHLGKPRVLLALDGALQYIPFGALPVKSAGGAASMLLETHEIVGVPSLSALSARSPADTPGGPLETLALFADPVLERADPRLDRGQRPLLAGSPAPTGSLLQRSSVGTALARLPATAREADLIAALVPAEQSFVARGFEASRDAVIGADLSRYRYVHFATHGLVDSRYPGLSALALSQFDPRGVVRDGFLRLHDVYNLRLNADLVVLSACETALGRDVRGEGLIGMTQGFMYAGARSVVASLWQVPDRATALLMAKLYGFMIDDGLGPAAALRAAQLSIAAERRWSSPYFWAGFVLVGDWR